jgi:hypothetical protein
MWIAEVKTNILCSLIQLTYFHCTRQPKTSVKGERTISQDSYNSGGGGGGSKP